MDTRVKLHINTSKFNNLARLGNLDLTSNPAETSHKSITKRREKKVRFGNYTAKRDTRVVCSELPSIKTNDFFVPLTCIGWKWGGNKVHVTKWHLPGGGTVLLVNNQRRWECLLLLYESRPVNKQTFEIKSSSNLSNLEATWVSVRAISALPFPVTLTLTFTLPSALLFSSAVPFALLLLPLSSLALPILRWSIFFCF